MKLTHFFKPLLHNHDFFLKNATTGRIPVSYFDLQTIADWIYPESDKIQLVLTSWLDTGISTLPLEILDYIESHVYI